MWLRWSSCLGNLLRKSLVLKCPLDRGAYELSLPLVTLEGRVDMSVIGSAFLRHLGKNKNIAKDIKYYIEIATLLVNDLDFLLKERLSQRTLMEKSDLMNEVKFGLNFGNAIKKIVAKDK